MRRKIVMVLTLALLLVSALAGTAMADVHAVSQAGCGNSSSAGATESREAPGRPGAPIPDTASGERTQGQGGTAGAQGENC
ncbi:MAG: hypothetical protein ACRDJP_15025 [Actinomycetota bacterium]